MADFFAERSRAQAQKPGEAQAEAARLGAWERRVSGRTGSPSLALRWPRPRASSLSGEGRVWLLRAGKEGLRGFETAHAAEWSSHLFPPPATGLNFCKFKLNGAFFCCLPEGACSRARRLSGGSATRRAARNQRGRLASVRPAGGGEGRGGRGAPARPGHRIALLAAPTPPLSAGALPAHPSRETVTSRPDGTRGRSPQGASVEELLGWGRVPGGPVAPAGLTSARGARRRLHAGAAAGRGRAQGQLRRRRRRREEPPGEPRSGAASAEPDRAARCRRRRGRALLSRRARGGGGAAEDAAEAGGCLRRSFLPAWVSGVPRERLRDFQHHKRAWATTSSAAESWARAPSPRCARDCTC